MHGIRALIAVTVIALSTGALTACVADAPEQPEASSSSLALPVNPACPPDSKRRDSRQLAHVHRG